MRSLISCARYSKAAEEDVELWFYNGGELSLADFLWLNDNQTQIVWDYISAASSCAA